MILSLRLAGAKRALLRNAFARYRNTLVIVVATALTVFITLQLLAPASAPNLALPGNASRVQALNLSWAKGDVVALVRHGERCDRTSTLCLGPEDGITVHGESVAQALGYEFRQMGLAHADIYSSLLTRSRQTADAMFVRPVEAQDWVFNCRGKMLSDVLKHKVPGRNLVLVTHSECMDELESQMHVPTETTFSYGASLFINVEGASAQPQMLGYVETKDWNAIMPSGTLPAGHSLEASRF